MCAFINLRRPGNVSASERLQLLEKHHQQARAHIDELEHHLVRIEKKMHIYTVLWRLRKNVWMRDKVKQQQLYFKTTLTIDLIQQDRGGAGDVE